MTVEIFDYVLIGAGTAGCVVTGRLSESAKFRVCVLEAGLPDHDPFIHIPSGVLRTPVYSSLCVFKCQCGNVFSKSDAK